MPDTFARRLEEVAVVRGVVGHEHGIAHEIDEHGDRHRLPGGVLDHTSGDPREHRDEGGDRLFRIDEGAEFPKDLAGAHLDRSDLRDPAVGGTAAGRLEVHHTESGVCQRCTVEVEVELGGVRQWDGGHVFDAMRWRRQNRSTARR